MLATDTSCAKFRAPPILGRCPHFAPSQIGERVPTAFDSRTASDRDHGLRSKSAARFARRSRGRAGRPRLAAIQAASARAARAAAAHGPALVPRSGSRSQQVGARVLLRSSRLGGGIRAAALSFKSRRCPVAARCSGRPGRKAKFIGRTFPTDLRNAHSARTPERTFITSPC